MSMFQTLQTHYVRFSRFYIVEVNSKDYDYQMYLPVQHVYEVSCLKIANVKMISCLHSLMDSITCWLNIFLINKRVVEKQIKRFEIFGTKLFCSIANFLFSINKCEVY